MSLSISLTKFRNAAVGTAAVIVLISILVYLSSGYNLQEHHSLKPSVS